MPKLKKQSTDKRRRLQKLQAISKRKKSEPKLAKSAVARQKKYLENEQNQEKHLARQMLYRSTAEYEEKHRSDEKARLQNPQQRETHNKIQIQTQKRRLEDPEQRSIHNKRQRQSQKKRLEIPEMKLIHDERRSQADKKRLEVPELRLSHNEKQSQTQQKRLNDPESRKVHNERQSQAQEKRLEDPKLRLIHNKRQSQAQEKRLEDPELRLAHNKRQSQAQEKRLEDSGLRSIHNKRQSISQKRRLEDPQLKLIHYERRIQSDKKRLEVPQLRLSHNERQSQIQKNRLKDPELRSVHNKRQSEAQRKRLEIPEQRSVHNERQSQSQSNRLSDPEQHEIHISRVLDNRRVREDRIRENLYNKFHKLKLEGPIYVCCCCERLNFGTSVALYRMLDIALSRQYMEANGIMRNNEIYGYLCITCARTLKSGKIPMLAMSNDELRFPEISESVAALSDLEERFVALMIPFMTIKVSIGDQYLVRGRAVNVPTEVQESVDILPRLERDTQIVPICFRRKKAFKSNIMFEMVRPRVILDSLLELQDSELYRHFNVKVDLNRISQITLPQTSAEIHNNRISTEINDQENDSDSTISDEEEPDNVADDATLLLSEALVFAPGEGKKPVSLFDEFAEAKSFLKIYGGKLIKKPSTISYQNWIKSEIMRSDRRCAHVTKLFFSALKLRTSKIATSISFCLRKTKLKKPVTVEDMLDDNYVQNMELHDSGYKVLAVDRGAPAYWEEKKREVFAMIRQLGPPTLFLTISAAETKWNELIVILKNIVDKQDISLDAANNLEFKEKARLIKSDPVTCARYFDYRMRQLFSLLKKKNSVFREHTLLDFYIRTEFQQRGSPHCHCLLWLHNAPKFNEEDEHQNTSVTEFVDRCISCSKDSDLENAGLLQFQIHKHTFTCRKGAKKNKKCRFDIPFFPLKDTTILFPLKNLEKKVLSTMQQIRQEIQDFLTRAHKDNMLVTIDDILTTFHLTNYEKYIEIIRSGIVRPTLMLKRNPEECMVNCYNKEILELNCANMDIQFIVDMYSCAAYVLNYLNKSTRGMSKLLRDATNDIRKGNYTMKEQLRLIGNSFLQASEFSAQEAVFYILALPLSKSSRQCVFINTNPPEKRVAVVKSKKLLENLERDSADIYVKNNIDHYIHRPDELEDICLAHFVAWYNYSSKPNRTVTEISDNEDVDDHENEENPGQAVLRLKDDSGYLHLRRKAKVIRYVRYNERQDLENFRRENVMLFVPWRNEATMITSVPDLFATYGNLITQNRNKFTFDENIDEILQEAIEQQNNDDVDDRDGEHTPRELAVFGHFSQQGDLAIDMMDASRKPDTNTDQVYIPIPNLLPESEYINITCSLNEKQRRFLVHIVHCFKLGLLPIYHCVLGGAGVGKSRLIKAVCQTLLRLFNKTSSDLESLKVLLCAPTGKAAFGINGTTLHSAFVLPLNQCSADLVPLSSSTRNTVFTNLKDVELIIIDEISMVGSRTIQQVDCRLKQIFMSPKPFAGISLIVFGDFNQLPPVGDRYIFESHATDLYGEIIGNPLWRLFTSFTLTEIMRQRDDAVFAETLNNLSIGNLTPNQVHLLESRVVDDQNEIPPAALRLYRTNADVDIYNKNVIDKDPNKKTVEAQDAVTGKTTESAKLRLLNAAKSSPLKDTQGLPYKLDLSLGVKYMVTVNVDVQDGLVNGAVGILKAFDTNNSGEVTRLWLFFPDQTVGKQRRTQVQKQGHPDWTALDKDKRSFRPTKNLMMVIRRQFPMTPAEAITIYKSQGGTYKEVAVQLKKGLRRPELYVALSRCTTLQGLYLIGTFSPPPPPSPHDKIQMEIQRLCANSVRIACPFSSDFVNKDSIVYHNVNSLKETSHWQDTNNFIKQQKPVLFIGAETRITQNDNIDIEGYKVELRLDGPNRLPGYGFVVYCRSDKQFQLIYKHDDEINKFFLMAGLYEDVVICAGYRSPSTPYHVVEKHIEELLNMAIEQKINVLFLGDFNIDLISEPTHAMFAKLISKGLKSGLTAGTITSDGNTGIDIIFSNFDLFCGVTETLFSDHKQLLCVLDAPQCDITERSRKDSLPLLIANHTELSLAEAESEGSALFAKLKQHPNRLDECDRHMTRRLCIFLRQGLYKWRRSCGEHMTSTASHFCNFKAIKVTGDGNCFYYALSAILCGKEKTLMKCLRAVEAAHIINNTDFIQEIETVMGREENDLMIARNILSNGRYAKIGDVFLLAAILERPINVYVDDSLENSYRFAPFNNNDEIHVHLDTRLQHYTALLPIAQVPLPPLVDHTLIQTEFSRI